MIGIGIQFCHVVKRQPNGFQIVSKVGLGTDQSVWAEVAYLGLSRKAVDEILEEDRTAVIVDHDDGREYVNSHAVVKNCRCPKLQKQLTAAVDELRDRLHPKNFRR
ncbi:MAG: hypothetical protein H0X66_19515 [Verrucomicrobia bacterium]|nr:hypothetical protein [Verrucomicrobiota bacterium]